MVARLPEQENIWPSRTVMWRAIQVVTVPESVATMASSRSSRSSWRATTSGFIGVSVRSARVSISLRQSAMPRWACSRKLRSSR